MDRLLRRQLDAIASDRRSGAAELALSTAAALQAWLRRHSKPTEQELLESARALLEAKPSMAPLLRLANEAALAADAKNSAEQLAAALAKFRAVLQDGPAQIADNFARTLRRMPQKQTVITYSYSSTVLQALIRARSRIREVFCSEGRPGCEGLVMAAKLSRAGISVSVATDAAQFSLVWHGDVLVLGSDMVFEDGFLNKIGTDVLVECVRKLPRRRKRRKPIWVLADTTKFWPEAWRVLREQAEEAESIAQTVPGPGSEVWKHAPSKVRVLNPYFWGTAFRSDIRILTERGWMAAEQVRRELKRIPISPRLKARTN